MACFPIQSILCARAESKEIHIILSENSADQIMFLCTRDVFKWLKNMSIFNMEYSFFQLFLLCI